MNKLFYLSNVYASDKLLLSDDDDQELILGKIIQNRIVNIAYENLNLNSVNKELKKALYLLKTLNENRYDNYLEMLKYLSTLLNSCDIEYAVLKGGYLCPVLYKRGQRVSNDIDLLLNAKNISTMQQLLLDNGFVQGYCDDNSNIIPATRKEIVLSRLNYGETVPFLKKFNGSIMEVDLNFSADYKPDDKKLVPKLLQERHIIETHDFKFYSLEYCDFFIHLCCHLYKEATTIDWLQYRRDLMLYKFSDINVFLHKHGTVPFFAKLYSKIHNYDVIEPCYYTLENSRYIYPDLNQLPGYIELIKSIKPNETNFMKEIQFPKEKLTKKYSVSFEEWFDSNNRVKLLEEVY